MEKAFWIMQRKDYDFYEIMGIFHSEEEVNRVYKELTNKFGNEFVIVEERSDLGE